MDAKLTLKLDKSVIEKAKEYAASHNRSLSRLVESYLQSLIHDDFSDKNNEIQISPFVRSMSTGVTIPTDINYKKDYGDYISEKYQ